MTREELYAAFGLEPEQEFLNRRWDYNHAPNPLYPAIRHAPPGATVRERLWQAYTASERCWRGTGRTTATLVDAMEAALAGQRVRVVFARDSLVNMALWMLGPWCHRIGRLDLIDSKRLYVIGRGAYDISGGGSGIPMTLLFDHYQPEDYR